MSKAIRHTCSTKALRAKQQKLGLSFGNLPSTLKDHILTEYKSVKKLKEKASKKQDWKAQYCLSKAYEYGVPELKVEQDLDSAIGWLESSIRNGNDLNYEKCHLGGLYDQRGTIPDQRRAFELYLESARAGVVLAQVNLAEVYRCGIEGVVYRDLGEAFKWYRVAAGEELIDLDDELNSPAHLMKSTLKELGIDSKIDAFKKLHRYYMMGDCPEGKPQPIKALYYLKKAAGLGDSEAQKDLGLSYLKGESGQPKDLEAAKRWLAKAAKNGSQEAGEILKKFDEQNIAVKVMPEPDQTVLKSNVEQYFELLQITIEEGQKLHPYAVQDSEGIRVKSFEKFPNSPTAQHYKKAIELRKKGINRIINCPESDENLILTHPDFEEGIKMLAQGVLYENSVMISHLQSVPYSAIARLIRDLIFKKLKINPNFFEGLLVLFILYPLSRRFSAESCKIDLRRTMFLNNIIHLIKKAEPNVPPTEDPYSYHQNYSSWLHWLYYFLGSNYIIAGCFKDGAEVFQKALDCCPSFSEAKLPLGSCLLKMSLKKNEADDKCPGKPEDQVEDNSDEVLLERFAKPKDQRIVKGDYRTWTTTELRQKARQLFMEYLEEVPECDKMYPEGHYHLAYSFFVEKNFNEALAWKAKGEDSEEKRLPFLPPFESLFKKYLRELDLFPVSQQLRKQRGQKKHKVSCETPTPSPRRRQDLAADERNQRGTIQACIKCHKSTSELKRCPCKKASYCGSDCQKADWKEHKKICTSKTKKKKSS